MIGYNLDNMTNVAVTSNRVTDETRITRSISNFANRLVVSGSSDNTIRLWDIECGACLRTLEGHEELVRCIR